MAWLPSESQSATREQFERDFHNASDNYERWKVLIRALDHIENLWELEEHRNRNR
jgi:hypothetical protein